jgi:GTP cyclohydrolase II
MYKLLKPYFPYQPTIPFVILLNFLALTDTHAGYWRVEEASELDASFGSITLNATQNVAGANFPATANTNINGKRYTVKCDQSTSLNGTVLVPVYSTGEYVKPVILTEDKKNYTEVNEYLMAALQYGYSNNLYWLPMQNSLLGNSYEACNNTSTHSGDTPFNVSMKIRKPFVGSTTFKLAIAKIYTGDFAGTAKLRGAAQTIYLSGTVTVPQSCKVNAGQKLDISFGDISANSFGSIGIGNKPANVNVQTRTVDVKCTNIAAQALLTLRVESEKSTGDMIQSNNPDIGFKIADQNNRVLSPNNPSSVIPFINQDPINITIKAWPVSITNKVPAVGPFRARGYLRVDFN